MSQSNIGARPAYPTSGKLPNHTIGQDGKPDGGFYGYSDVYFPGMTMRQFYKAAALQLIDNRYTDVGNEAACAYEIARYSGMIADAMLAEDAGREKENGA